MGVVIACVEHNLDVDDLQECVNSGKPSNEYSKLQEFLNECVDDFNLAYL